MELEGIMLSQIGQSEKYMYQMISFMCEVRKERKTEGKNSSRHTVPESGLTATKEKGTGLGLWEGSDKGGEKEWGH